MLNRIFWVMLLVLGLSASLMAAEPLTERQKKLETKLQRAVHLFKTGRYIEARSFLEVIGKISDAEAKKLRDAFGKRMLHQMASFHRHGLTLGGMPVEILRRATNFDQSVMFKPEAIAQLVGSLVKDPRTNAHLFPQLMMVGQYAVPDLVEHLRSGVDDVERVNAEYILVQMGPQVAIPVSMAMESKDNILLQQCANVLRRIRPVDPRVLAYLKAVYENTALLPTVRAWPKTALEDLTGKSVDSLPSAATLALKEADRLYRGGAVVEEQMFDLAGAFWMWDQAANGGKGRVRQLPVPIFALDDLMAQQRIYKAMGLLKAGGAQLGQAHIMLASSLLQQAEEVKANASVLGMESPRLPDIKEHETLVKKWQAHLFKAKRVAATIGARNMVSVLDKALLDNKVSVAKAAMESIQFIGRDRGWAMVSGWTAPSAPAVVTAAPDAPKVAAATMNTPAEKAPVRTHNHHHELIDNHAHGHAGDHHTVEAPVAAAPAEAPGKATAPAEHGDGEHAPAEKVPADEAKEDAAAPEAISKMVSKSPEELAADAAAAAKVVTGAGHPLLRALSHPHRQIRITAANVLIAIGLPVAHPAYAGLIPTLVEGVQEKSAKVCLVIHQDPVQRERLGQMLRAAGIAPVLAANGREGLALAKRFPPKDAILIDGEIEEFAQIRHRLLMFKIVQGSPLPVVVITHRKMVNAIKKQFPEETWAAFVSQGDPANPVNLYNRLAGQRRAISKRQVVAIVVNEDPTTHRQIKNALLLEAEKRGRPDDATNWLNVIRKKSITAEIYPVRSTLVNIFLDTEVSGFNVQLTVKELRKDERTNHVPIAILGSTIRLPGLAKQFTAYLTDKANVRLLGADIEAQKLEEQVTDMTKLNPLNKEGRNYVRIESDTLAQRSAASLVRMNKRGVTGTLTEAQGVALRKELLDTSRPIAVRTGIADVLGVFNVTTADGTLAKAFAETAAKDWDTLQFRVHLMDALGMVDLDNSQKDLKYAALDDPNVPVQEAGARALALVSQGELWHDEILGVQKPNDALRMLNGGLSEPGKPTGIIRKTAGGKVIATPAAGGGAKTTEPEVTPEVPITPEEPTAPDTPKESKPETPKPTEPKEEDPW